MRLTFGSLFAGIGGLDLGLERAGMECKWQVEIDDDCNRVLEKHWPTVPRIRDVRDVSIGTVEAVDVVCGGFPCQPVSSAGKQEIEGDLRWLWPEVTRVVDELRPRIALLENVLGLLECGIGAGCIADLASLGYDSEWCVLPASAFGAPHKRQRVFIAAYANGYGWPTRDVVSRVISEGPGQPDREWRGEKSKLERGSGGGVYRMPDAGYVRVDDGLPSRLDRSRIKQCGNAVVPQVAEYLGRQIMRSI